MGCTSTKPEPASSAHTVNALASHDPNSTANQTAGSIQNESIICVANRERKEDHEAPMHEVNNELVSCTTFGEVVVSAEVTLSQKVDQMIEPAESELGARQRPNNDDSGSSDESISTASTASVHAEDAEDVSDIVVNLVTSGVQQNADIVEDNIEEAEQPPVCIDIFAFEETTSALALVDESTEIDETDYSPQDAENVSMGRAGLPQTVTEREASRGYLYRKGYVNKTWRRQYFVLDRGMIASYDASQDGKLRCILPMPSLE